MKSSSAHSQSVSVIMSPKGRQLFILHIQKHIGRRRLGFDY